MRATGSRSTHRVSAGAPHRCATLLIALFAATVTGCSSPEPGRPPEPAKDVAATESAPDSESSDNAAATELVRGRAVFGHQTRSFIPCGEDEALWVREGMNLLGEPRAQVDLFAVVDARRLPAPSEGFGADYAGGLAIEFVHYAGFPEGPRCDFEWDSFRYRARGNEPFWMLDVTDLRSEVADSATEAGAPDTFSAPEAPVRLRLITPEREVELGVALREPTADGWQVHIRETPMPVELTVRREPCHDSMSGNYFGYSAAFRFEGGTFTGCVLIGTG